MEPLESAESLVLLERQTEVLELLVAGAPLRTVLEAITSALERLMPASRCSVLLLDPANGTLHHGAAPSLPKPFCDAIDGVKIGPSVGSCGTAAYLGVPVIVSDIAVDERWADYKVAALPHGLRACWSMPIVGNQGAMLGTFAVYHDVPHSPTPHAAYLVERFTHLTAVAIDHSRLFGALADSEERFRRAFEDNAVGMALLSLDGRFVRVNRALCDMVARREDDLLAGDLQMITHPDDVRTGSAALRRISRGVADSMQLEQRYLQPDGTSVTVTVTVSALRGADGAPIGFSANVVDLSERRAAEEERRARHEAEVARTAAEAASRAKSEFLSALSHEVRTPLSAVVGFAELLETLELTAERRHSALGHIGEAANHIIDLLDDVLDIAKIEAGVVQLELEPIPIGPIVTDVVALVEPLATERGVTLTTAPLEGDRLVMANRRRVRQVLLNVVSNAIKYNRAGGRVELECFRRGRYEIVRVTDTGPGIPRSRRRSLFVPFDRLGAEASGIPGTGLGLPLARGVVEAMGGTITIRSRPGNGTTVLVALRTAAAVTARTTSTPAAPAARPQAAVRADVRGVVVYVEDDITNLQLVKDLLEVRPGIQLLGCSDGQSALATMRKRPPDIVLLDLDLPDTTGEAFLAILASHPGLASVPVAIISGRQPRVPVDVPVFGKPLDVWGLLAYLDRTLDESPGCDPNR